MSYPKFVKDESCCAYCKSEIENEFVTVRENFLVVNFFDDEDGEDNIFCDRYCLAEQLFIETVYVEENAE